MDIVDEAKRLSMEALRREAIKALQDEKKQQLQRSHSRLDEAALAREHLIINQVSADHAYARDAVSAWLQGTDGSKGDPNAVSTIYRCSILSRAIFWRVLAFWRTDRDLPHHIATSEQEPPIQYYD